MEKIEYIDKEELLGSLERKIKADNERRMAVVDTDFIDLVNDATVIEDVVEVVRCKDCKHWGVIMFRNVCRRWSASDVKNCTMPNDFCSYGERKETTT